MPGRLRRMMTKANAKMDQAGKAMTKADAKMDQAGKLMTKVEALLDAFMEEFTEETLGELDDLLDDAGHTLGLVRALTGGLTPEHVVKFKAAFQELVDAVKEFLDRNDDGKINIDDFPKLKRLKTLVDLIRSIIPGE